MRKSFRITCVQCNKTADYKYFEMLGKKVMKVKNLSDRYEFTLKCPYCHNIVYYCPIAEWRIELLVYRKYLAVSMEAKKNETIQKR